MRKTFFRTSLRFACLNLFLLGVALLQAQVSTIPAIIQKGYKGEITIIFNPNKGNQGMAKATACYAHIGLITSESKTASDWKYATDWQKTDPAMTLVDGKWQLLITPDIYTYYGCPETEEIQKMVFVFNDGKSGGAEGKTAEGGDIFVDLAEAGLAASIQTDLPEIASVGTAVSLRCHASQTAELSLSLNGKEVQSATGTEMTYTATLPAEGNYAFQLVAKTTSEEAVAEAFTCVPAAPRKTDRPAGVLNGIYYDAADPTKVTLCTYAASKTEPAQHVFVVGDFNDWTISNDYQLAQATDSAYFWITLSDLTPKQEYAMQYVVVRADGVVKYISDLYSEKLLHPDDQYEPRKIDPTLMDYPAKGRDYVTVIQTAKEPFAWSDATLRFQRPDKNNLIIYELWVYDHTPFRNIEGLMERLDYLHNLGVNAVELMPVNEFDGNQNWGYSPNHYFALDKAYGTPEQLKTFIDECHKRGIAVILDMVFNHATGLNPMNKLYPYGTDLKNNPWFNVSAPHPDNVYEDWNHDFAPAHSMFTRALQYWLTEYKIDGYRLDLSHGICGPKYNAVDNLKDYYAKGVQAVSEDAYMILEHWGSSMASDRPQLIKAGMLCWQNTCNAFEQTAMGWLKDGDSFAEANQDGYVSYPESHDEERAFFKAKQWGDGDMKTDEAVRVGRVPLNMAFATLLNGSHMFYHFAELGYDNSKFQNAAGQWGTDGKDAYGITAQVQEEVKMQAKMRPESAGWFREGSVRMAAYQKTAQAIQLRTRLLPEVFEGNPTAVQVGSGKAVRTIQWGNDVFVVGNFSASAAQTATLPSGTWYDYYAGGTASGTITLQPGELKIYTGTPQALPEVPAYYDFAEGIGQTITDNGATTPAHKVLIDGVVYIVRNGVWYDLMGRKVK